MKNFNRGGRSHDRHGGGFGRRDRERPTMHHAVCDACHKDCEVPFKPTNDKPIYCSDCFSKQGGGNRSDRFGGNRDRDRRPRFDKADDDKSKEILKAIKTLNYKVDELMKAIGKTPTVVSSEEATEKPDTVIKKAATKKAATTKKTVAKKTTKKAATTKKAVTKKKTTAKKKTAKKK